MGAPASSATYRPITLASGGIVSLVTVLRRFRRGLEAQRFSASPVTDRHLGYYAADGPAKHRRGLISGENDEFSSRGTARRNRPNVRTAHSSPTGGGKVGAPHPISRTGWD